LTVDPGWLHSRDNRKTITATVKLPAQIPAEDIDTSTLQLNSQSGVEKKRYTWEDSDGDGISELRIEFALGKAARIPSADQGTEIMVAGKLKNGLPFAGRAPLETHSR
jgi:hypothetical protein